MSVALSQNILIAALNLSLIHSHVIDDVNVGVSVRDRPRHDGSWMHVQDQNNGYEGMEE